MSRKKINKEDKKISIGITIHPELFKLIENFSKENNINRSKFIQKLLEEYFSKNNDNE